MENKQRLVGPLEQGRPKRGSPDADPIFQHEGVGELPQIKISKNNDRQSKTYGHFYPGNNDGGRES